MALLAFPKGVTSMVPVLPEPIRGLIALWQGRLALQGGGPDRAAAIAQKGLEILGECVQDELADTRRSRYSLALRAALTALLATSQKRTDPGPETTIDNFKLADAEFVKFVSSDPISVAPFLWDYLAMLAEFGETDKSLEIVQSLNRTALNLSTRDRDSAALMWLRFAMISCTPRMVLELGASLRAGNDDTRAFSVFMHSAGMGIASNDHAVSSEAIECALAICPEDSDARRVRGLLRWHAGEIQGARSDFAAAVAGDPENVDTHLARAYGLLNTGAPSEASEVLDIVISKVPDHVDAHYLRGECRLLVADAEYSKRGAGKARTHWKDAVTDLTFALQRRPEHAASRLARAVAYYNLDDPKCALRDLELALTSDPDDFLGHGWRAAALLALKRDSDALAAVNVAFALIGDDALPPEKRAWLLGLKGRALLGSNWPDQAIAAFAEAVIFESTNKEIADLLIQAHKIKRDWAGLAQQARSLQSHGYDSDFLLSLRVDEVTALRLVGDYDAALDALNRIPRPRGDSSDIIWLHARILADMGDFEGARDKLLEKTSATLRRVDHLSLRGWVVQNLEPRNQAERRALADDGHELYKNALELAVASSRDGADLIWLRKGLANAILRGGEESRAVDEYRKVIEVCEARMRSADESPRILALIGWCYHCMGDGAHAASYYEAAIDKGEQSAAVAFDYSLVLAAETAIDDTRAVEGYKTAVCKTKQLNLLRRIGLFRVALHDLKELVFRSPKVPSAAHIAQMLCLELLQASRSLDNAHEALAERVHVFVETALTPPMDLSPVEREAVELRIQAGKLLLRRDDGGALVALEKAAQSYSSLHKLEWAATTWRDAALLSGELNDAGRSYDAAIHSLEQGLFNYDPTTARSLIRLVTKGVISKLGNAAQYPSVIEKSFSLVGRERAYLDAPRIIESMSDDEHRLFAETVLRVFPYTYDSNWIYIRDGDEMRRIPGDHSTLSPFLSYLKPSGFAAAARHAALEATR